MSDMPSDEVQQQNLHDLFDLWRAATAAIMAMGQGVDLDAHFAYAKREAEATPKPYRTALLLTGARGHLGEHLFGLDFIERHKTRRAWDDLPNLDNPEKE